MESQVKHLAVMDKGTDLSFPHFGIQDPGMREDLIISSIEEVLHEGPSPSIIEDSKGGKEEQKKKRKDEESLCPQTPETPKSAQKSQNTLVFWLLVNLDLN